MQSGFSVSGRYNMQRQGSIICLATHAGNDNENAGNDHPES